jgi:TolA-binding protein
MESDAQLLKKGMDAAKAGRNEEAIKELKKLTLMYPDSDLADNAHYNLGIIYKRMKKYNKAINEFKTVVEHYPDSDAAIFAPDEVEALQELTDPACERFYKAQSLLMNKKMDEARAEFEKIIEEFPDSDLIDNAYLAIAQIDIHTNNSASAIKILDMIEKEYAGTDGAALVEDLRKML